MNSYTNTKVVESKVTVAKRFSLGGLAIMLPGLAVAVLGLANPASNFQAPEYLLLSYISLIAGTIISTIGGRLAERWLVEPRDDQKLAKTLKGLDKRYRLINYNTPADHLLLTPTGLFVILMKSDSGPIKFDGKQWIQPGGIRRIWHDWRHGGLGNPIAEAETQIKKLQGWLKLVELDAPIASLIVFGNPKAELEVAGGRDDIMALKDLKVYLLQHTTPAIPSALYRTLSDAISPQTEPEPDDDGDEPATEPDAPKSAGPSSRRRRRRQKKGQAA
ncbi:MAG: NERD domain-containing protein [Chloroflexi bacterium]|nr:NERD domain-containing protein [Chloroflexota bacterium]